jgi:hypothetical protein
MDSTLLAERQSCTMISSSSGGKLVSMCGGAANSALAEMIRPPPADPTRSSNPNPVSVVTSHKAHRARGLRAACWYNQRHGHCLRIKRPRSRRPRNSTRSEIAGGTAQQGDQSRFVRGACGLWLGAGGVRFIDGSSGGSSPSPHARASPRIDGSSGGSSLSPHTRRG